MALPTESYLKVDYRLRPSKQVERRMILDALRVLMQGGFSLGDYQYTGLGSFYFVDFILLHKFLGLTHLLSVEMSETIQKRVAFNKPFDLIDVRINTIGEVIPTLNTDRRHIIWLDYDHKLIAEDLEDVKAAVAQVSTGSIILVTTDIDCPNSDDLDIEEPPESQLAMSRMYYEREADIFLMQGLGDEDFAASSLAAVNCGILERAIKSGLAGRLDVEFMPLFNFAYADGHRMLTLGGMIGSEEEKRKLNGCDFSKADYVRRDLTQAPFEINVPQLTRRERLYLDAHMPCADNWTPEDFELDQSEVEAYRRIYRFCPLYVEMLL